MKKILLAVLLIFSFAISTSLAYGGNSMYLKLTGIDGESVANGYEDWIDITAWSWDITQSGGTSQRAAAKTDVGPIYIQKYVDQASPLLFLKALNGGIIYEAELVLVSDDYFYEIVRIEMDNAIIVNIQSGDKSSDGRAMESVALSFSEVCYKYKINATAGSIDKCWDLAKNQEK